MSADAKVWSSRLPVERRPWWEGLHDGPCNRAERHKLGNSNLRIILQDIELCMGGELRWEIRSYPDNQFGLVGFVS